MPHLHTLTITHLSIIVRTQLELLAVFTISTFLTAGRELLPFRATSGERLERLVILRSRSGSIGNLCTFWVSLEFDHHDP